MQLPLRFVACALAVVLMTGAGRAQRPTFRAGISLVRVDVVATDKDGQPVTDLTVDDFELTEDGKRQPIETFRLLSLGTGARRDVPINNEAFDEEEAARDDVRVFGIFLDDYHVSSRAGRIAADQLAQFIERELEPSDMIGIMHPLTLLEDVQINRDRRGAAATMRAFRGRRDNLVPINAIEENYLGRSPRDLSRIRREVSLSAVRSLIVRLGTLKEGRKTLILVTEGYGGDSAATYGDLRSVTSLASRYNTAIYPVNPQILIPRAQWTLSAPIEAMRTLAEDTGGRAVLDYTRNNAELQERRGTIRLQSHLAPGLKQIAVDASANYLLGYRSPVTTPEDRLHRIEVKVKRRGVEVRYRRGWWSLPPTPQPSRDDVPPIVTPKAMQIALNAAVTPRDRLVRTWIGQSQGARGLTRLTFVWEPAPRPADTRDTERPSVVVVTATNASGATLFTGGAVETAGDGLRGTRLVFEAEALSTIRLRWTVENGAADLLDSETRTISVSDLSSRAVALGTPQVFRARTTLDVRRFRADPQIAPAPAREFSRAERLLIRVPVYGPAGPIASPMAAQLLNRAGRLITSLPVAPGNALVPEVDLSLGSLPPDDYALRFIAGTPPAMVEELMAFRVVH